jgi:hypothetical protein
MGEEGAKNTGSNHVTTFGDRDRHPVFRIKNSGARLSNRVTSRQRPRRVLQTTKKNVNEHRSEISCNNLTPKQDAQREIWRAFVKSSAPRHSFTNHSNDVSRPAHHTYHHHNHNEVFKPINQRLFHSPTSRKKATARLID